MMSAGHTLAAGRAMAYLSKPAMVLEHINGIPFYRLLEGLEKEFEDRKEELISNANGKIMLTKEQFQRLKERYKTI